MGRKKEIKPKRDWSNICHYSSDLDKVKNLNETYRFVYFKPKEYHHVSGCAEWVYFDISLDDLIHNDNDICNAKRQIAANYDFVARLRCTGIKDKFENLIFEGDVTEVKLSSSVCDKGCVIYDPQSGGYSKGSTYIGSYKKLTEVIGDIFSNPDYVWRLQEQYKTLGIPEKFRINKKEDI